MVDFYDNEFRQLLFDHKKIIQLMSSPYRISNTVRDVYKYRDILFIKEELNYPEDSVWLIKFINDIDQFSTIVENEILYLPDLDFINSLYERYLITKSKKIEMKINE